MLNKYSTTVSLGRNQYQTTIGIKPVNYQDGSTWKRIVNDWADSGVGDRPHIVTDAPFMVSVAPDGDRRIHPTREQNVWFEMSGAKINQAGTWKAVKLGTPTSRKNNRITWNRTNFNAYIDMAGHYVKLAYLLKNGFMPPNNQFAYEVATNGLTRQGGTLLKDGVPVMHMRKPIAYDYDNPDDVRQIAHEITRIDGKWHVVFTLPSLAGMSKPLIDPTLELQPDAAAGKDTKCTAGNPDNNYGIDPDPYIAGADLLFALFQFDVSSISGNTASSAALTLRILNAGINIPVHRCKVEWFEGEKDTAAPGATDGSTWNHRNANTGGQVAWTGGAGGTAGTEYEAVATATFLGGSLGDRTVSGLTADVQHWMDGNTNYGWWFDPGVTGNSVQIASSDHATAAYRPKLVVVHTEAGKIDTTPQFFPILFDKKKH